MAYVKKGNEQYEVELMEDDVNWRTIDPILTDDTSFDGLKEWVLRMPGNSKEGIGKKFYGKPEEWIRNGWEFDY